MRIGLAGGGSDLPTTNGRSGAVVSAAINLFAHANMEFDPQGSGLNLHDSGWVLDRHGVALRGAVHHFMKDRFRLPDGEYRLLTSTDMPPGCGLGSSSALVVAAVRVYSKLFGLELRSAEVARFAWEIERQILGWFGGYQDQYASAYGGVRIFANCIENISISEACDRSLNVLLEERLCIFDAGEYKVSNLTKSISSSSTSRTGEEAYQLWSALCRGDIRDLPSLLNNSNNAKQETFPVQFRIILESIRVLPGVEGLKVCGSGPLGVALVCHDGDLSSLSVHKERAAIPGKFRALRVVSDVSGSG